MNGKTSRILVLLMVVAMLVTAALPAAAAPATADQAPEFTKATAQAVDRTGVVVEPKGATGPALYIVELTDAPLATYRGGVEGLAATSTAVTGDEKLNSRSSSSEAYIAYLEGQQSQALDRASNVLGRPVEAVYQYVAVANGFTIEMTPAEAAKVAAMPDVLRVTRDREFELQTDAGPAWIQAPGIWDGSMTGGLPATYGEGVIVGVIDTGIDPWNPSFADVGGDGYDHTNPWGDSNYVGVCDPGDPSYDPTFPCNDKLIGAWGYSSVNGGDPRDSNGHGSHTSSTAAGNFVMDATLTTPTGSWSADISGVAPHANLVMYAACCTGSALTGARDQVVLDGVDAVNYSIGAGAATTDPWNDTFAQQWLAVREAGIFVATSAGNAGPGDATVGSPGDMPWLTTVGASSHNRAFLNSITLDDGANPTITLDGMSISTGYGPAEVVLSADFVVPPATADDARLCAPNAFPAGTFSGQIVVCERGAYGRVAKGQSVLDGGAGGYILAQPNEFGGGPGAVAQDTHVLPAVHIDYYAYQALLAYLAAAPGDVMGTISGAAQDMDDAYGNVMASFSSRGQNRNWFSDLIVPNVTAPGRGIWAAYHQGDGGDGDYTYNIIQGTSMSSPHVAGAGALMVALHPDWSPAEIESALMSTADTAVLNDDGMNPATWFAQGSGNVQLGYAAQAGLILDVTTDEFMASDPREGGDPRDLNLASLSNATCVSECSWTRTFQNPTGMAMTYNASLDLDGGLAGTVTPDNFAVDPGASVDVTVTVDVSGVAADQWYFGILDLTPVTEAAPAQHLTIAVQPTTGDIPELVEIVTGRDAGSKLLSDLTSIPISDMTIEVFGLALGSEYNFELDQDPTNGDPYDNLDDVWWMAFDVPAGSSRMVAEVVESAAPDADLFWGTGDTPGAGTQTGASTTGSWNEYLSEDDPTPGTYWVLVQNWGGSDSQPDAISLVLAVVDGDAGNMWVDGPASVGALEPFDLTLYYDEDMEAGQYWYGAFTIGTDPGNPGNVGRVDVNLQRIGDDVTKMADVETAAPGDTVTYTIYVQPNSGNVDLSYSLTDTIPAGMSYVDGSATANFGDVMVDGNQLTWTGVMAVPTIAYNMTTSADDPMCDTPFGGYVNLEDFGILTQDGITGDTEVWAAFSTGDPISFFGMEYSGMGFTDDGFAIFDPGSNYAGSPWISQTIPDADAPNNLLAINWQDFEIFYDEALNHGVSLATAGTPGGVVLVEYDDIQFWGGSADTFDFEVIVARAADNAPGVYEIVYAYDNLNGSLAGPLTIGIENAAGDNAVALVNNGSAEGVISDGFMVCFDQVAAGVEPAMITYQATVDGGVPSGTELTNNVVHVTDAPGSMPAVTSDTVLVDYDEPDIMRSRRYDLMMDTFIDGSRPDEIFGNAGTFWVGYQDLMRPVVWTEIPVCDDIHTCIPSDAAVDVAYLYIFVKEGRGFANWNQSKIEEVSVHAVLSPWDEATTNWLLPWTSPGGDIGPAMDGIHLGSGKVGTWMRFDITDHVAQIVNSGADNYGFALTSSDPGWGNAPEAIGGVRFGFAAREYWDPSKIGYVRVMYRTDRAPVE
ncbi:MAG: S8 family serine peptidase [Chloroflexota bacterium]|nr:S8 family serine peptidase [Chloroflexota bacterium]